MKSEQTGESRVRLTGQASGVNAANTEETGAFVWQVLRKPARSLFLICLFADEAKFIVSFAAAELHLARARLGRRLIRKPCLLRELFVLLLLVLYSLLALSSQYIHSPIQLACVN
jgi:hypothetical protein